MPLHCSVSNSCFPLGRWFQKQQQIKTKQNSPKPMNQLTNENPNLNHHKRTPTYTIKSNITLQFRPRITQEQLEFFCGVASICPYLTLSFTRSGISEPNRKMG